MKRECKSRGSLLSSGRGHLRIAERNIERKVGGKATVGDGTEKGG